MKHTVYSAFFPLLLLLIVWTPAPVDDGFDWQTLESGMLTVHWYDGDIRFGQEAMETAQAGLQSMDRLVPIDLGQPIEIFMYATAEDLRGALVTGGEDWVAGHADPEQGVARVLIEPGREQGIAMEQRIPHELMHIMLYRRVGAGYKSIPGWLREGLATLAEMYPNPDHDRVLRDAAGSDSLIPLKELCSSFPADTGQAFLAYAESRSFTNYLLETYGAAGVLNLAVSYASGLDCERGTERAFGVSLSSLERNWHSSTLSQNSFLRAVQDISPYLVLLCLVLFIPLIGIASTLRKKGT